MERNCGTAVPIVKGGWHRGPLSTEEKDDLSATLSSVKASVRLAIALGAHQLCVVVSDTGSPDAIKLKCSVARVTEDLNANGRL